MTDKNVVDFAEAKRPHVFKRQEKSADAMRDRFKAARAAHTPEKSSLKKKLDKRKSRKKRKK